MAYQQPHQQRQRFESCEFDLFKPEPDGLAVTWDDVIRHRVVEVGQETPLPRFQMQLVDRLKKRLRQCSINDVANDENETEINDNNNNNNNNDDEANINVQNEISGIMDLSMIDDQHLKDVGITDWIERMELLEEIRYVLAFNNDKGIKRINDNDENDDEANENDEKAIDDVDGCNDNDDGIIDHRVCAYMDLEHWCSADRRAWRHHFKPYNGRKEIIKYKRLELFIDQAQMNGEIIAFLKCDASNDCIDEDEAKETKNIHKTFVYEIEGCKWLLRTEPARKIRKKGWWLY